MMHHTNIALVELSNRLTGLIGKHFQSKGEGNQDSLFQGMDELLKRISFINRKSVRKIKVERERKEYYRKKVRRMRQKFILKRTLLPSSSAIFPITQKSIEKKIARNEIKLKYAMRRYHTVSERNAQDIAGTLALCGEFFQPCFKQMILWLVTYYRSVAGAFDELGSCLENDGDGKANEIVSSPLAPAKVTPRDTQNEETSSMKTRSAPSMTSKRPQRGIGSLALSGKSKSDGELAKTHGEDSVEHGTPPLRLGEGAKGHGLAGPDALRISDFGSLRHITKVHSKSDGEVVDNSNLQGDESGNEYDPRQTTFSESTTLTSGSDGDSGFTNELPHARQRSRVAGGPQAVSNSNSSDNSSIIVKYRQARLERHQRSPEKPFLDEDYLPPTLGDNKAKQNPIGFGVETYYQDEQKSVGAEVALPEPNEIDEPLGGDRPYTILGELGRGKLRQNTTCNEALTASVHATEDKTFFD